MHDRLVKVLLSDRFWQALGLIGIVGLIIFSCAACTPASQFLRGFEDEGLRQLRSTMSESVNDGLSKLPAPATATDLGLAGSVGSLLAYVLGSVGKGYVRGRLLRKEEDDERA